MVNIAECQLLCERWASADCQAAMRQYLESVNDSLWASVSFLTYYVMAGWPLVSKTGICQAIRLSSGSSAAKRWYQICWCRDDHTHLFNGPLSGTTRVSRYQKGKTDLDFAEPRDSEWQWHQLGSMQVCTSLQTDNHASTPPLSFLQAGCPSCRPTNSVKALKAVMSGWSLVWKCLGNMEKSRQGISVRMRGKLVSQWLIWRSRIPVQLKSGRIWMQMQPIYHYMVMDLSCCEVIAAISLHLLVVVILSVLYAVGWVAGRASGL